MHQTTAVFLLIALSLVAANAPFLFNRPLIVLPWAHQGVRGRALGARWALAAWLWTMLAAVAWFAPVWIGSALAGGAVLVRVLLVVAAFVLLLAAPGWSVGRARGHVKPFWHRLLELCTLYALVGSLGFALEANLGSRFAQGWAFYAVSASLFLVMAYPGFVARYLFKRRDAGHPGTLTQARDTQTRS